MEALVPAVHAAWAITLDGAVVGGINVRYFCSGMFGELGWSLAELN